MVFKGRQFLQRASGRLQSSPQPRLLIRGDYTWSKALDDGDSLNATAAGNAPGLVSNPFDMKADWGPATYDVTNEGSINEVYELPFGKNSSS